MRGVKNESGIYCVYHTTASQRLKQELGFGHILETLSRAEGSHTSELAIIA